MPHTEPRDYFVSIIRSSKQRGILAGPFATHTKALVMVDAAKRLACQLDPWADFDSFGTCWFPAGSGIAGKLNERLGVTAYQPQQEPTMSTHQDFTVKSNARRTAKKLGLDPASVQTIIKAGAKIYRLPLAAPAKVPAKAKPEKKAKAAKAPKAAKPPKAPKSGRAVVVGAKFEEVLAMLRKPGGAAISAICKTTGWLGHTARARISVNVSKLLNKGEVIQRRREDGESHYAVVPDKQQTLPGV